MLKLPNLPFINLFQFFFENIPDRVCMFFVVNGLKNSLVNIQGTLLGFRVVLSNLINKILCTICLLDIMFNQTQERWGGANVKPRTKSLYLRLTQNQSEDSNLPVFCCLMIYLMKLINVDHERSLDGHF